MDSREPKLQSLDAQLDFLRYSNCVLYGMLPAYYAERLSDFVTAAEACETPSDSMRTLSSTMLHAVSDGVVRDEALQTEIIELADRVPTFRMGDPRVASIVTRTVAHINTTRQSSQAGE